MKSVFGGGGHVIVVSVIEPEGRVAAEKNGLIKYYQGVYVDKHD